VTVFLTEDLIALNLSGDIEPGASKCIAALDHTENVIPVLMGYEHGSLGTENRSLGVSDPRASDVIALHPTRITESRDRNND
jgi:hypothetical protein